MFVICEPYCWRCQEDVPAPHMVWVGRPVQVCGPCLPALRCALALLDRQASRNHVMPAVLYRVYYAQEGRCYQCDVLEPLEYDHDWRWNRFRALLCRTCNRGSGRSVEIVPILQRRIAYVEYFDTKFTAEANERKAADLRWQIAEMWRLLAEGADADVVMPELNEVFWDLQELTG